MTTPETLTEEERAWIGPASFDAPVVTKLLRIHDALQARVKELEGEREPDIEPPGETIAKLLHEKTLLDVRVKELEIIVIQAIAEGFGVIRGADLEPPAGVDAWGSPTPDHMKPR